MDIILQTGCEDPALAIVGIERFADDSGFSGELVVRSHGFSATHRFYFGAPELRKCVDDLAHMDATLSGAASLSQQFEPDRLEFDLDSFGHVYVSGEIMQTDEFQQQMRFAFRSDQTILGPLLRDLRACVDMPVRE